eukprot:jgi/Chlat1/982/Chrsp108S01406
MAAAVVHMGPEALLLNSSSLVLREAAAAGRGVFAARRLDAGDEIMADKPYVCVVNEEMSFEVCCVCYLRQTHISGNSSSACERCRCVWYLQRTDLPPALTTLAHIMVRALLKRADELKAGKSVDRSSPVDANNEATFGALTLLEQSFDKFPKHKQEDFLSVAKKVHASLPEEARLDVPRIASLVASEECNAFGVYEPDGAHAMTGFAVYPRLPFFNHACIPNTAVLTTPGSLRLSFRTLRVIEEGEEVCISYIAGEEDKLFDRDARRSTLKENWLFDCGCILCSAEPTTAKQMADTFNQNHRCLAAGCHGLVFPDHPKEYGIMVCSVCRSTITRTDWSKEQEVEDEQQVDTQHEVRPIDSLTNDPLEQIRSEAPASCKYAYRQPIQTEAVAKQKLLAGYPSYSTRHAPTTSSSSSSWLQKLKVMCGGGSVGSDKYRNEVGVVSHKGRDIHVLLSR